MQKERSVVVSAGLGTVGKRSLGALKEAEINFDVGVDGNRLSVLQAWPELLLPDRLDRLLIETEPERADHADIAGAAIGHHHNRQ
jgi:hypothetical protein